MRGAMTAKAMLTINDRAASLAATARQLALVLGEPANRRYPAAHVGVPLPIGPNRSPIRRQPLRPTHDDVVTNAVHEHPTTVDELGLVRDQHDGIESAQRSEARLGRRKIRHFYQGAMNTQSAS